MDGQSCKGGNIYPGPEHTSLASQEALRPQGLTYSMAKGHHIFGGGTSEVYGASGGYGEAYCGSIVPTVRLRSRVYYCKNYIIYSAGSSQDN